MPRWLTWLCLAVCCVNLALVLCRGEIARFWVNAEAGCWPWSPAVIEWHPGVTICPGQTAVGVIILPALPDDLPPGWHIHYMGTIR